MLYTGKGDKGTTKTFGCDQARISKSSELPEALGTLDELNSYLGLVKVFARNTLDVEVPLGRTKVSYATLLRDVQESLFVIQGSRSVYWGNLTVIDLKTGKSSFIPYSCGTLVFILFIILSYFIFVKVTKHAFKNNNLTINNCDPR